MEYLVLFLVFGGVIASAGFAVVRRWILREHKLNETQLLAGQYLSSIGFFILVYFFIPEVGSLSQNGTVFWAAVIVAIFVNGFINFATAKASRFSEATRIAPIQALTSLLIVLSALVLLGEKPSVEEIIGIGLVMIGITWHEVRERRFSKKPETAAGIRWMYAAAIVGVASFISGALIARNGSVALGFLAQALVLGPFFAMFSGKGKRALIKDNAAGFKKNFWWVVFYGALFAAQAILLNSSFRFAQVANISTMKRFNIFFVILFSHFFLGEKRAFPRLGPAICVIAGTVLLGFGSVGKSLIETITQAF